ncbi:MAG: alpha/beta fold hydrolase [Candidatus Acidiferrales bacterium]
MTGATMQRVKHVRRETLLAILGIVLIAAGSAESIRHQPPTFEYQLDACHTPVTVMEPYQEPPLANAIVLHGLAGNRHIMAWLGERLAAQGLRVYMIDLAGHGDSTEPFTYANAESCAGDAIAALADRGDIHLDRTVLLGHSMGAEIAIRLADRFPTAATIALSPAPLVPPRRMPSNLLVVSAQFDVPWLRSEARHLARDAGGDRTAPDDFAQLRAFHLADVSLADHVSVLTDPRVSTLASAWAREALGIPGPPAPVPGWPRTEFLLGCVGIILLFPLAATIFAGRIRPPAAHYPDRDPETKYSAENTNDDTHSAMRPAKALRTWAVACVFAVALLAAVPHYSWLGLSDGSYLATCLLIAGVALFFLVVPRGTAFVWSARGILAAIALALLFTIAARAWLAGSSADAASWMFRHTWAQTASRIFFLTKPRLLRLAPAALAVFPYFLAEEVALGPRLPGANWRRFALFAAMRFELWVAMIAAYFLTMNGNVLIGLLLPSFILISVLQHYGSEVIRRRTGSPAAAAIFGAIIAAWFIVSFFPLT